MTTTTTSTITSVVPAETIKVTDYRTYALAFGPADGYFYANGGGAAYIGGDFGPGDRGDAGRVAWCAGLCNADPDCVSFATFYPDSTPSPGSVSVRNDGCVRYRSIFNAGNLNKGPDEWARHVYFYE